MCIVGRMDAQEGKERRKGGIRIENRGRIWCGAEGRAEPEGGSYPEYSQTRKKVRPKSKVRPRMKLGPNVRSDPE